MVAALARMWVWGSLLSVATSCAPVRTPATYLTPAFAPARRSFGVSPATSTCDTPCTSTDSIAWPPGLRGDRPRLVSAGRRQEPADDPGQRRQVLGVPDRVVGARDHVLVDRAAGRGVHEPLPAVAGVPGLRGAHEGHRPAVAAVGQVVVQGAHVGPEHPVAGAQDLVVELGRDQPRG